VQLGASRLVAGRRAARRRRDVALPELESVAAADRQGLAREPVPVKGLVQPIAARIAREDPSGPIPAVSGRRQADDEQSRAGIAEPGHGSSPVLLVAEGSALLDGHAPAVGPQARAALA